MKTLYVAWQDPELRRWFPIGRLTFDGATYRFVYTRGSQLSSNFRPFSRMQDLGVVYESNELFPLFSNRLLSKSRPEYGNFLKWLNVEAGGIDPITMLALTGGVRGTDTLEMFPCPERDIAGEYLVLFFSHGLSHFDKNVIQRVASLKPQDRLFLMLDIQNQHDPLAIALRTDDPKTIVGYCPRFLNDDFHKLISQYGSDPIRVSVERVNQDAPLQLRLLCRFVSPWPEGFEPCSSELYKPLKDA